MKGERECYIMLHNTTYGLTYVIINSNNRFDRIIMALSNYVVVVIMKRDYRRYSEGSMYTNL